MRKLLVVLMVLAFAAVGFAAEVKLSGKFEMNGVKVKFDDGSTDDSYGYYDQNLELYTKIVADAQTSVYIQTAIMDKAWAGGDADAANGLDGDSADDNVRIERAFLTHKFNKMFTLSVGTMDGGGWGNSFGNNVEAYERIKLVTNLGAAGNIVAIYQKSSEQGYNDGWSGVEDNEEDDGDLYFLAYVGKFGPVTLMPAYIYRDYSQSINDNGSENQLFTTWDISAKGQFGPVGFEADYIKHNYDWDDRDDYSTYGIHVNVFGDLGKAKVGFIYAYGSTDEENGTEYGFDFGDDFNTNFVIDELGAQGDDLIGYTLYKLYADAAITDKISVYAAYAMGTSNWEDDDTDFKSIDLSVGYAITKNLSYAVNFGWMNVDVDGQDDDEKVTLLSHGLSLQF